MTAAGSTATAGAGGSTTAGDSGGAIGGNGGAAGGTGGSGTAAGGIGSMTNGGATSGTGGSSGAATAGAGGVSSGAAGGTGGTTSGGGGTGGSRPRPEIHTSIPEAYRSPNVNAGKISRRSYPCHYYTDTTGRINGDPRSLVLERRTQPITKELNIYTPHGYDSNVKYPIIFVLHGITDNQDTWFERGRPHPSVLLDNLIAKGDIEPVVAVFPNGNASSKFLDRSWENQGGYYVFASELVNDIIPFVEKEYSVRNDRNSRALCGFSMGGMQTINAGLCQSLEHFSWFGAFAAAPTSYTSENVATYLGWENEQASYPVNFFYNVVGSGDDVARASHQAAVNGLPGRTPYVTNQNFAFHTVDGAHDYAVISVGLYNILRIAFAK